MAKVAKQFIDEEDFSEFLEAVAEDFHVVVDYQTAETCKTVGEFENLVYDQIVDGKYSDRARDGLEERLLNRLNTCITWAIDREIQTEDLHRSMFDLAGEVSIKRRGNFSAYDSMCYAMNSVVPTMKYRVWAKVVMWLFFVLGCVGVVYLCLNHEWILGLAIGFMMLIALGYVATWLPMYAPEPDTTLNDAIDRYLEGMEKCNRGMSFSEFQFRLRHLYAMMYGVKDRDSITADTPFHV
ncbi:hypothetical protein COB72_10025 [bacterium]|nr:MAG: hypothetical protein COB72_10025 [bacterium]